MHISGLQPLQGVTIIRATPLKAVTPLRFGEQSPRVTSRKEGTTQYITLSDPRNANRLSREMIKALDDAFQHAEQDPGVKQIVLESASDRYFCPGADLQAEMRRLKSIKASLEKTLPFIPKSIRNMMAHAWMIPQLRSFALSGHWLHQRIANSPKVTIAKMNGSAIGGGVELGLACDYIIASNSARFAIPEVKYGIYPDWGATERLPQRIGRAMAKFLILEGGFMADKGMDGPATLTAAEALKIGMIDAVVAPENLDSALKQALANGQLSQKVNRPVSRQDIAKLDDEMLPKVAGTRFADKLHRYRTASTNDLLKNELKGLYPPTIQMNVRRIESGPKVDRLTIERDLLVMFYYFGQVNRFPAPKD